MQRRPRKGYLSAYASLYGNEVVVPTRVCRVKRSSPKTQICSLERDDQIAFVSLLEKKGIIFYAIPNGGSRNLLEAVNLKRQGVKPGIPDICIPIPTKSHHGLYIELKRLKNSRVSDNQRYWIDKLNALGYRAEICHGWLNAIRTVEDYLKGR